MPFSAPYNPPTYPRIQTSKCALLTSIGSGQVGASNNFYIGIIQSSPTNMVATITNPLGIEDTGATIGSLGFQGHNLIPRSFYDNGYGLQFRATIYIQYGATWTDLSFEWYWTGIPAGVTQYGNMETINGNGTTYVKATFDSGILVPGSDYNIGDINSSGVIATDMYANVHGQVGTDPLLNVENSPGLEIFAWSF